MTFAFPVQFFHGRDMHGQSKHGKCTLQLTALRVAPSAAIKNTQLLHSRCRKRCWRFKNSKNCPGQHAPGPPKYSCFIYTSTSIDFKINAVVCQLLRLFAAQNGGNVILDIQIIEILRGEQDAGNLLEPPPPVGDLAPVSGNSRRHPCPA